jgi:hypothetical protein
MPWGGSSENFNHLASRAEGAYLYTSGHPQPSRGQRSVGKVGPRGESMAPGAAAPGKTVEGMDDGSGHSKSIRWKLVIALVLFLICLFLLARYM